MRRFYETNTFKILPLALASLNVQLYIHLAHALTRFLAFALKVNKPQVTKKCMKRQNLCRSLGSSIVREQKFSPDFSEPKLVTGLI